MVSTWLWWLSNSNSTLSLLLGLKSDTKCFIQEKNFPKSSSHLDELLQWNQLEHPCKMYTLGNMSILWETVYSRKYKHRWDHVSSCTNSTTKCDKLTSLCRNNSTDLLNTGCSSNFSWFLYCSAASLINVPNLVWCPSLCKTDSYLL